MSAFGDAFKSARAAGKKVFEFNGKKYHTRTKDDEAANSKKNTKSVSSSAGKKIAARANTPNTSTKVVGKKPSVGRSIARAGKGKPKPTPATPKAKPKAKPKKVNVGDNYKAMAANAGVPGKKKRPVRKPGRPSLAAKPKAKPKVKPKNRTYGRNRNSVILNNPRSRG